MSRPIACRAVVIPVKEYVYPWPHWVREPTTTALKSPDHPFRGDEPAAGIPLRGAMSDLDLGTAVAAICAYNVLGFDDEDRLLPDAPAVLAQAAAEARLIAGGAGICPYCRPSLERAANGNQLCLCGGEVVG
jgi:hypothetical protein